MRGRKKKNVKRETEVENSTVCVCLCVFESMNAIECTIMCCERKIMCLFLFKDFRVDIVKTIRIKEC